MAGIHEAELLVGRQFALGAITAQVYAHVSENDAHRKELVIADVIENAGLLNHIHFSPLSGNGVVYDKDGDPVRVFRLWNSTEVESAKGVHIPMLMQGTDDIVVLTAGVYPYKRALEVMLRLRGEAREKRKTAS